MNWGSDAVSIPLRWLFRFSSFRQCCYENEILNFRQMLRAWAMDWRHNFGSRDAKSIVVPTSSRTCSQLYECRTTSCKQIDSGRWKGATFSREKLSMGKTRNYARRIDWCFVRLLSITFSTRLIFVRLIFSETNCRVFEMTAGKKCTIAILKGTARFYGRQCREHFCTFLVKYLCF